MNEQILKILNLNEQNKLIINTEHSNKKYKDKKTVIYEKSQSLITETTTDIFL